ncbi:MAG: hypothetical protein ACRD4U_00090, partial [Candidatus Acidiferrales bacterium]
TRAEESGRAGACPPPETAGHKALPYQAEFAERLAALEQRLEAVSSAKATAEQKLADAEGEKSHAQIANFVETLRSQGRFPPMFDRWGVAEFLHRLAETDSGALMKFSSGPSTDAKDAEESEEKAECPTLLDWFQDFLTKLPAVIEFREIGAGAIHRSPATNHRSPVVRFTEPQRGMSVDPASVELAERAEALAAEESISYAEALTRLREERRAPTTA